MAARRTTRRKPVKRRATPRRRPATAPVSRRRRRTMKSKMPDFEQILFLAVGGAAAGFVKNIPMVQRQGAIVRSSVAVAGGAFLMSMSKNPKMKAMGAGMVGAAGADLVGSVMKMVGLADGRNYVPANRWPKALREAQSTVPVNLRDMNYPSMKDNRYPAIFS